MSADELRLAMAAYKGGQLAEAIDLCDRGIARVEVLREHDEAWRLRILLSQCLCYQGNFARSMALLEGASMSDGVSPETRARLLNQRGFALSRSGDFGGAKAALDGALRLAAEDGSRRLLAEIEINRSTLFFYLGNYTEVETCARAALDIGEAENLPLIQASACAGLGKSYMYRDRQAEAIPWFERALTIFEEESHTSYADIMRSELGCCHFALHDDDKAFELFTHALRVSRESGALASLHIDLANMGALHLRRGEYAAAISHFQEALQIARKIGDTISVSKWLKNLSLSYESMGNPELAKSFELESERVNQRVAQARAAAAS